MDLRVRKIRCAADMVGVEMREDDVADVLAAEAESVELVCRRFGRDEHRPGEEPDRPHPSRRVGAVVQAEAGVDEDQTVVGFDEQDVTDAYRSTRRVHGAAVEVVDLHRPFCSSRAPASPTRASTSPRPICVTRLAESK